jgi:hypothetical protein
MACDGDGNVIMTATSFGSPGEVRRYFVRSNGSNNGWQTIVTSPDRPETVRCTDGRIYFSNAKGIFEITPPRPRGTLFKFR